MRRLGLEALVVVALSLAANASAEPVPGLFSTPVLGAQRVLVILATWGP